MSVQFSKPELIKLLQEQFLIIEDLCLLFDQGKHYVVKDIATKLRVLFHNTTSSKALLYQLKLTHVKMYCGCLKYDPKNLISHLGMVTLDHDIEKGWSYGCSLEKENLARVEFNGWWGNKLVIVDTNKNKFTRSKIIKYAANKDGGAHVDVSIDQEYYDLTRKMTSGWVTFDESRVAIPINPIPPTIRKIAFEVLETFKEVDLFAESKLFYKESV